MRKDQISKWTLQDDLSYHECYEGKQRRLKGLESSGVVFHEVGAGEYLPIPLRNWALF